jgi:nucleoside-diphosphate-sugar epimerase
MARVVLLGAGGFAGRALSQEYERAGKQVVRVGRGTVDLTQAGSVNQLGEVVAPTDDLVICSALTPERGSASAVLAGNLLMAAHLAQALDRSPPARCVFVSSDAVYPMQEAPITENTRVEPTGAYAVGKYATECAVDTMARARKFPLLTLRATALFGAGDTHDSYGPNRFCRQVSRREAVALFGEGEERRDHLFIDDFVSITMALHASGATGVYNIATGSSRSFASIVDLLRVLTCDELAVAHKPRGSSITHREFDQHKLLAALPQLQLTPFRDGLEQTLAAARGGLRA